MFVNKFNMGYISYTLVGILAILTYAFSGYIRILYFSDSFLNEFEQSDLSGCISLPELKGCEDLAISYQFKKAIIGCPGNHLLNKQNIRLAYNPRDKMLRNEESFIYAYDFETQKVKKLNIVGFPKDINLSFQGLDLVQDGDQVHVMAINHRHNNIDVVEHFVYENGNDFITYKESFLDQQFENLNGIVAISKDSFYVTKDMQNSNGFISYLEQLSILAYGSVLYRDNSGVTKVSEGYKYANGLAANYNKDILYLSETMEAKLHVFNRDKETGELDFIESKDLPLLPDNLKVDAESGNIYLTGFPKALGVFEYYSTYNTPQYKPVHGVVARIKNETGEAKFFGNNYKLDYMLMDFTGKLSTASVAARFKDRVLVSALLNLDGVLDCPLK